MIIIRSQDRMFLQEPKRIQIRRINNIYMIVDYRLYTDGAEDYDVLGEYESKERALEVLDMIQKRILSGTKHDTIWNGKRTTKDHVFEMPEE